LRPGRRVRSIWLLSPSGAQLVGVCSPHRTILGTAKKGGGHGIHAHRRGCVLSLSEDHIESAALPRLLLFDSSRPASTRSNGRRASLRQVFTYSAFWWRDGP